MSIESIAIMFLALAVGAFGKAITGFGLPLIAIPFMAAFMGVEQAVVVMVIPATLTNLWVIWEHRARAATVDRMWLVLLAGVAGAVLGTWLLSELNDRVLALLTAGWIAVYILNRLFGRGFRIPHQIGIRLIPPISALGGVFQGATGMAGPVVVTYMHAMRMEPAVQVFVVSVIFMSYGFSQIAAMASFGLFTGERLLLGVLALIPAILVMPIGFRVARVINRRAFDISVIVLLIGACAKLTWAGIMGH